MQKNDYNFVLIIISFNFIALLFGEAEIRVVCLLVTAAPYDQYYGLMSGNIVFNSLHVIIEKVKETMCENHHVAIRETVEDLNIPYG